MNFEIRPQRRSATFKLKSYSPFYNLQAGVYPCEVLGIYQVTEDEACSYPGAVCELSDGRVIIVDVSDIVFTDVFVREVKLIDE